MKTIQQQRSPVSICRCIRGMWFNSFESCSLAGDFVPTKGTKVHRQDCRYRIKHTEKSILQLRSVAAFARLWLFPTKDALT